MLVGNLISCTYCAPKDANERIGHLTGGTAQKVRKGLSLQGGSSILLAILEISVRRSGGTKGRGVSSK